MRNQRTGYTSAPDWGIAQPRTLGWRTGTHWKVRLVGAPHFFDRRAGHGATLIHGFGGDLNCFGFISPGRWPGRRVIRATHRAGRVRLPGPGAIVNSAASIAGPANYSGFGGYTRPVFRGRRWRWTTYTWPPALPLQA